MEYGVRSREVLNPLLTQTRPDLNKQELSYHKQIASAVHTIRQGHLW